MQIFQKSIINKHLLHLDENKVRDAYEKFRKFYGDKERLQNIMHLKEENYQEGFLREIFVDVLGYTLNPDKNYNLTTEYKNLKDNRKADGAILAPRGHAPLAKTDAPLAVIELKSTKTKDLESIKEQAFGYKNNQPECKYVITSNFQSIRFYIDNATEYEESNLFEIASTNECNNLFKKFFLIFNSDSILNDMPAKLKAETRFHEEEITKKLYKDYKALKDRIFENLISANRKYDKLTLFKKSQKLLDRFLFIFFAEDCGLIPPNAISKIIERWKLLQELEKDDTLYSRFQLFFRHIDKGHTYKNWGTIPAYNGGLFSYDEILDSPELRLPDGLLLNHLPGLSAYDFSSEVDVNILGHIFEHSLSEIEELTAELSTARGQAPLSIPKVSKRKKDGIFYTPQYITKYIVENTVGTLCNEKKKKLQINNLLIDDSCFRKATTKGHAPLTKKGKQLFETLQNYKTWLFSLKILDPACGSGAFLNQTLDFLITQHKETDNRIAELTGDKLGIFDTDIQILENNIFGVDINEESVEIAKLSLWLRTARPGRVLSDLSNNIKCGNSLIDDPKVAGEKAFDWNIEFKEIMDKGGFDVVIGNPPYVDSELMTKYNLTTRKYIAQNYQTAKGNWDLYIPFIERGFQLIKKKSFISFITPNKWLSMPYGKYLRKFTIDYITQICDFQKLKVFESADVFPIIFILKKDKIKNITIKLFEQETRFIKYKLNKNNFEDSNFGFLLSENNSLLIKIKNQKLKLGEISEINGAFTTSEAYELIPLIKNFHEKNTNNYMKFVNTGTIDSFIHLWEYEELTYLKNKYCKPVIDKNEYKSKFTKRFEKYDKPKIIISGIRHFESFFDENNEFIAGKSTTVLTNLNSYNYETILCILNSKLLTFYIKESYSTSGMGGGINFSPELIRNLPIPQIDKITIEKIKSIYINLHTELLNVNHLIINIFNIICSDFNIEKPTKKIKKWYLLTWNDFVTEIKKIKGKFNKNKQLDWIDFFKEKQIKINNTLTSYHKKITEIDHMVYKLYELTPEEIEIVENATK